ncbi:MAG TPA: hypothetical protein VM100_00600 [Longimicrobiales bacterium]|nr:hypothetical protein [Longimicrobiales bacterium]
MKFLKELVKALLCLLPCAMIAEAQVVPHRWVAQPGNMMGTWVAESPNGKFLLLEGSEQDSLFMYVKATRQRFSLRARGVNPVFAPTGDRIVFQLREKEHGEHVWVLPIDANSGRPTARAQRVSLQENSRLPTFSPDGKTIAFHRQGKIYTVSSRGGEEHVLVDDPKLIAGRPFYTPDGKWIYFRATEDTAFSPSASSNVAKTWIRRVSAAGGPSQRIIHAAHPLGISPSGKYLAYYPTGIPYQSDDATIGFATIDGKELTRKVMPIGTYWGTWGQGDRFMFAAIDVPVGLNRIDLATNALKELTPKNAYDHAPAYSPNGKMIVSRRIKDGVGHITLLTPEGKVIRDFSTSSVLDFGVSWSSDNKHVAYLTIPRHVAVLDVTTGVETILANDLGLPGPEARFAWRSDGKALRYVYVGDPAFREVREVTLDGKQTTMLRLDSSAITRTVIFFIDDDNLLLVRDRRISLKSMSDGKERTLYEGDHGLRSFAAVSADRKWVSIPITHTSGGETVAIVPLAGGAPRILPFVMPCGIQVRDWHPDGRHIMVASTPNCGDRFDLFLLPLDGGPARNLTAVDKVAVDTNTYTLSPDGKYVVYDSELGWFTRIGEINVPLLVK